LCKNRQQQSCKAFIGLSIRAKMMGGTSPKTTFASSEPSLGEAAMHIIALTKFEEYSICITMITMQKEITNNVH